MTDRAQSQREFIGLMPMHFNAAVLDIGAGAGKLLEQFLLEGISLFAVESDPSMLIHLSNNPEIQVFTSDALFLNDPRNHDRFDLVTLSHVFEHLNDPITYLNKLASVIKPGGHLFLEVPNEPEEVITHYLRKKRQGIGHLFHYTIKTLFDLIESAHVFEIVKLDTFGIEVSEYIEGISIRKRFDKNERNDGIWIRALLKREGKGVRPEWH
jgi:2-polyprenyl-3-methyl-5-hydroxy-6-metoxy-1,4-benzoquinol methylase